MGISVKFVLTTHEIDNRLVSFTIWLKDCGYLDDYPGHKTVYDLLMAGF